MLSNLVLDVLFARRPKIRYTSPPICGLIQSPTSSGAPAVSLETISPLSTVHYFFVGGGLAWNSYPGAICYNVYRSNLGSTSFLGIVECGPQQILPIDPGCYVVTAITQDGETPFGTPICTETFIPPCTDLVTGLAITGNSTTGFSLVWNAFPGTTCYNVYNNGTLFLACVPFGPVALTQTNQEQCFTVTAQAMCGETAQGTPVCLSSGVDPLWAKLTSYWTMNEPTGSTRNDTKSGLNPLLDAGSNFPQGVGLLAGCAGHYVSNLLAAANSATLSPGLGVSFSFSGWVAFDIYTGFAAGAPLWGKTTGGYFSMTFSGEEYELNWGKTGDGTLRWGVFDALSTEYSIDVNSLPHDGSWHHIACGYDSVAGVIWLQLDNGARLTHVAPGASPTNNPFTIGTFSVNNGTNAPCRVDELCFANGYSFTLADVTRLYNGGSPLPPPFS